MKILLMVLMVLAIQAQAEALTFHFEISRDPAVVAARAETRASRRYERSSRSWSRRAGRYSAFRMRSYGLSTVPRGSVPVYRIRTVWFYSR